NHGPSTGPCEAFGVATTLTTVTTTVIDNATGLAWSGSELTGAAAHDTAVINGQGVIAATGSVTYSFFANTGCTGTPTTQTVVVNSSGGVPDSNSTGALAAGGYAFRAAYGGDVNYSASPG